MNYQCHFETICLQNKQFRLQEVQTSKQLIEEVETCQIIFLNFNGLLKLFLYS